MAEKINDHDFIELDFTGKLPDGTVFDTTLVEVAKENGMFSEKAKFAPVTICVGEHQLLTGMDKHLEGKEVGEKFTVTLAPEEAFGKRDIKKIQIVPSSTFKQHKLNPQPGLQIELDGERGIITRVAGGRVIVNFNHPLAGKEVVYEITINKKVDDKASQIKSYLNSSMRLPKSVFEVEIKEEKAEVKLPFNFPPQFSESISKKLVELTKLKEVVFIAKEKKAEEPKTEVPKETTETN